MKKTALLLLVLVLPVFAQERVDLAVIDRIKAEAFDHSKVMEILYNLSEVHGPRLTGSPGFNEAAQWAMDRLKNDGIQNVHSERWGPFGRSWSLEASSVEMIAPRYAQLVAMPLAWSNSTNGP